MNAVTSYNKDEAVSMLAFSTYAYIDDTPLPGQTIPQQEAKMRADIDAALKASAYKDWQVTWGPVLNSDRSNMMYVAGNATTHRYVVAIRGTDPSFWLNWLEDAAAILGLVPFPYTTDSTVQIALGTCIGLEQLVQMTAGTAAGTQISLVEYLKPLVHSGASISVTGHSLGGCLASVVAPWLAAEFGSISKPDASSLKVYTFAAPSAGNGAFATQYNNLFWDTSTKTSRAYRFYNSLDVVPNAWASLAITKTYYTPFPSCPDDIKTIIDDGVEWVGTKYAQVGSEVQGSAITLPGHILFSTPLAAIDPVGDALFLYEAYLQHGTATYMSLLEAAPVLATLAKLRGVVASRHP